MKKLLYLAVFLFAFGCKLPADSSSTTTKGKVPVPAAPQADRAVDLTWAPAVVAGGPVQGYKIEASGDGTSFVELGTVNGTATTVTITGLYSTVTYYFRVRAFNQSANSAYGPTVQIAL